MPGDGIEGELLRDGSPGARSRPQSDAFFQAGGPSRKAIAAYLSHAAAALHTAHPLLDTYA